ncbi:hypothetical protein [Sodalis sp.]|uniref:hypothetical protein n=1 Tax=Sodalis sp. (in: enterobacteria) TaxID=1898979 RepID=UPI003872F43E
MLIDSVNVQSGKWPSPHELSYNSGKSYRTFPEWLSEVKNESVHFDKKPKPSDRSSVKRYLMEVLKKLVGVFQWKQSSQISCQGQQKNRLLDIYSALFSRKAVATVIVNGKEFKNWKILKTPANDDWAAKSFIKLKKEKGSKILDSTFVGDIGRAEYIVNGENIPRVRDAEGNIDKLAIISEFEKRIPNDLQRQLISLYANQALFADVAIAAHNAEYAAIPGGKVTFNINQLSDGTVKLIADCQQDFRSLDELNGNPCPGKYRYSQLLRAAVIIPVPDKGTPTVYYCYSKT